MLSSEKWEQIQRLLLALDLRRDEEKGSRAENLWATFGLAELILLREAQFETAECFYDFREDLPSTP